MARQLLKASRPVSVTIIGWLLTVGGLFSVLATISSLNDLKQHRLDIWNLPGLGKPPTKGVMEFALWANVFISAAFGVCGQMFLNGRREARPIYVGVIGVSFVLSLATLGLAGLIYSIPSIVCHSVTLFFLFRAPANAFFLGLAPKAATVFGNPDERAEHPARQEKLGAIRPRRPDSITFIGWLCIIGAAFNLLMTITLMGYPANEMAQLTSLSRTLGAAPPSRTTLMVALWIKLFICAGFGICGYLFLRDRLQARRFYVYLVAANYVIVLMLTGRAGLLLSLPSIVCNSIVLFFLFRARANQYFTGVVPTQAFQVAPAGSTNDAGRKVADDPRKPKVNLDNFKIK